MEKADLMTSVIVFYTDMAWSLLLPCLLGYTSCPLAALRTTLHSLSLSFFVCVCPTPSSVLAHGLLTQSEMQSVQYIWDCYKTITAWHYHLWLNENSVTQSLGPSLASIVF